MEKGKIVKIIAAGMAMIQDAGGHPKTVYMSHKTLAHLILESPQVLCVLENGKYVKQIFGLKIEGREDLEDDKIIIQ